jgi:N-acetyl-anhydromuramyl-L-alanine amidase AmpD
MIIQQRPLTPNQYFARIHKKSNIVLHHTVSSSAASALRWWAHTPERIATAFLIEKDGSVIQAFDDKFWAHHLGIRSARNVMLNQQSIGIELVNEGFLWPTQSGELKWLHPDGPIYKGETITEEWRSGKAWPIYPAAQIEALKDLLLMLTKKHQIPTSIAPFGVLDLNVPYQFGIYAHHNVRADKTDVSPAFKQYYPEIAALWPKL